MMSQPERRKPLDGTLGIGAFGHAFKIRRLDAVTERRFHVQQALMVLIAPAIVADRADINPAGFRVSGVRRARECQSGRRRDQ